ncbi:MAG TPA: metallopeptidase TldD-related protein [Terracidiphilus sp.]|nr:metallopeptidase TldD-related protein [Terracidiphilus sp.]
MSRMRNLPTLVGAVLLGLCVCAPCFVAAQQTRADAEKDPVLNAMLQELDRSMSQLQLKGFAKPFFIQYRIEDVEGYQTKAEFGASEGLVHNRERVARVTVRVGDYKIDNTGAGGDGAVALESLDDDPIALRSALWMATDQAYKNALAAYAQKQAALKQVQTPPQADDFSHEKPVVMLETPPKLSIDAADWVSRMAAISGAYRKDSAAKDAALQYSRSEFDARAITEWLATSEGTIVRKGAAEYRELIAVGTQAPDGMSLDRSYTSTGTSLKDLDAPDAFNKHAQNLIASLVDLRKAPLVEDEYHGPLLLSADADADTMNALLSDSVTATRPALGTQARTNGAFASSYQTRVMPDFVDVVDDPGLKDYGGKGLVGAFDIDEEGVPAQAVNLISEGRLVNYLIGRQPVRDFPQSNGHGRAGLTGEPHPEIGVLKITARNGLSDTDLNAKLIALAKDDGQKSAYYAETLGGANSPRLLYRVNADGTRVLVRGAALDDIDQRALRSSIVAAGKDLFVANYYGDVPTTVLAPALLLDDVTVRRANRKNQKLPFYPPPE